MKILRTPDSRFENLPDYDFAPNYVDVLDMRMHYVDEGPRDGEIVLLLHGEPSWSYLYRFMIPALRDAGFRVIAPDLVGFGKSDKPASKADYSYAGHVDWMTRFIDALELRNINLFCQDWGSLIGLRVAAENPQKFSRIVLGNGLLPTGVGQIPKAFKIWQRFARFSPWFPIGRIIQKGTVAELPNEVMAAYDAPFPSAKFKAGARAFPMLVPTTPDDPAREANLAAWEVLKQWDKPFLTTFSNRDPVTRGADRAFQKVVPGAQGQEHVSIKNAGHFLQEEKGPELAEIIIRLIKGSSENG
jgi:haloalkane dehalogenase